MGGTPLRKHFGCRPLAVVAGAFLLAACHGDSGRDGIDLATEVDDSRLADSRQIETWVADKAQFNQGFMPPGSQAHEDFVDLLLGQLRNTCLVDVEAPTFPFTRWAPQSWSLVLIQEGDSESDVDVAGYIPFSGTTPETGLQRALVALPQLTAAATSVRLDGEPIGDAIGDYDVADKLVVVRMPRLAIPLAVLEDSFLNAGDDFDIGDFWSDGVLEPTYFTALLGTAQVHAALEAAGAAGLIAILPLDAEAADNLYAPFEGEAQHLPGLYLDRDAGAALLQAMTETDDPQGRLTLDVVVEEDASARNIAGVLPGNSERTIVLSSHTDATNTNEDNGPAAILAIVDYFCSVPESLRPVTLEIVLHGAHLAGNRGLRTYVDDHHGRLTETVIAALELEHLGALEWAEQERGGPMALSGRIETQLLTISSDAAPFVEEALRFAAGQERILVAPREALAFGAGDEWVEVTTLVQYITGANYLLSYHIPGMAVTTQFQDYDLMRDQIRGFIQMILNLGNTPIEDFD